MSRGINSALVLVLLLVSCTVGPDYHSPAADTPVAFHARESQQGRGAPSPPLDRWWLLLGDDVLTHIVRRALENSQDLSVSAARVREARARLGVVSGRNVPNLSGSADYNGSRRSPNAALGGDRGFQHFVGLGFDSSWEIDLFGQIARSTEAATADLQASIERLRDVRVTLLADIARSYVQYRLTQTRLSIAEGNRDLQAKTLGLVRIRFDSGLIPELDLRQAERILATTGAEIPSLQAELQVLRNALAVLSGDYPGALDERLAAEAPIPEAPDTLTLGVPADLLRRRPDIRAAERDLAAATAQVGVSTAELYPKLSLAGTLRLEATNPDHLLSSRSAFYKLGPSFSWNLFSGGRVQSQIEADKARVEQSYQRYRLLVRRAVEEVESALLDQEGSRLRRKSLSHAVDQAQRSVELSRGAYEEELVDFQNVLDNQRTLLSLQDQLAQNQSAITVATLRLYKALGGGWTPPTQRASTPIMQEAEDHGR